MNHNSLSPVQHTAYFLLVLVLLLWILHTAAFIVVPLVWGIFFAFSLYPLSNWLEEKRFPRALAIGISIILITIIGIGVMYVLINQMLYLLSDIPEIGEKFWEKTSTYMEEIVAITGIEFPKDDKESMVSSWLSAGNLNETIFSTGKSLTLAGIIPLYTFLLLYYKDFFTAFLLKVSSGRNAAVLTWVADSGKVIHGYIVGMIKVTIIVAILAGFFFYLIDVKYYLLFAIWIAIMNLIPYIGVIISSALVILYVFLTTDSIFYPLLTLAVLWGIQALENNFITPYVVGSKVNVNVLAVVLAILIGGGIWGISGMVLFIPLIGILKITFDRIPYLKPYGYLLGDTFPIHEKNENFVKLLKRKWKKK